jgi:DNA phosphorothioation-associated putative methyltransferase
MYDYAEIVRLCQSSDVGKRLPGALYLHRLALPVLDPLLQAYERSARLHPEATAATLIKFSTDKPILSYLFYPDFDRDPHPPLTRSILVDTRTGNVSDRNYREVENPPILHRKETFVTADYPLYEEFAYLTAVEEALGLLDRSRYIGTRWQWQQRLQQYRLDFQGHRLICPVDGYPVRSMVIDRHRAAIARKSLSRPTRLALEAGLFSEGATFFDYGCGYGVDIDRIAEKGYESAGWDPYYRPDSPRIAADIVNLGYVINVIEERLEREEALQKAWELTRQVLIVSAQVLIDDSERGLVAYEDGIITRRNTFQKYYQQEELKQYIDRILQVDSIPIALGIYVVFRDESQGEAFRLSRYRSRATTPRITAHLKRFEDYEALLTPLMEFYTRRGRLPGVGELEEEEEIKGEFETFRRAFQVILQVTEAREWEAIADKRRQDLILYLALSHFSGCPTVQELSPPIREDLKALFGSYRNARALAGEALMSAGDLPAIDLACQNSPVGKYFRHALTLHISALDRLSMLLRLYEGCASQAIGRLEEANVIRLSSRQAKISYLYFPDFDENPHPVLQTRMDVYLGTAGVSYKDYTEEDNPPILHEKERLVTREYPLYEKFTRLTKQERDWGLLDDRKAIDRLKGWEKCLLDHCAVLKGYRLYWRESADPYRVKLLKAAIESRRGKGK